MLGLHDRDRAWKSLDRDAMNRLHAKGLISDPANRAKSVAFTKEGLHNAETLLQSLFGLADWRTERQRRTAHQSVAPLRRAAAACRVATMGHGTACSQADT